MAETRESCHGKREDISLWGHRGQSHMYVLLHFLKTTINILLVDLVKWVKMFLVFFFIVSALHDFISHAAKTALCRVTFVWI